MTVRRSVTYCMGYWRIHGNPKRDARHYRDTLEESIKVMQNSNLLFFTNDKEFFREVERLTVRHNIKVRQSYIDFTELPAWNASQSAVDACKKFGHRFNGVPPHSLGREKAVIHFWRDLKGGGEDVYRKMQAVWLSKTALVSSVAKENPFADDLFAWVDVSIGRQNRKRKNWDFSKLTFPKNRLSHYASRMKKNGKRLPLSAGFLSADAPTWRRVDTLFQRYMICALCEEYGHDEETILAKIYAENPEIFYRLDGNVGSIITESLRRYT